MKKEKKIAQEEDLKKLTEDSLILCHMSGHDMYSTFLGPRLPIDPMAPLGTLLDAQYMMCILHISSGCMHT